MSQNPNPSVWNEIKNIVVEDLQKAAFDNLKNYAVIGAIVGAVKKSISIHSIFLTISIIIIWSIPGLILLRENMLRTQIIATIAFIGKKNYAVRAFGNKATSREFYDAARWQFLSAIAITILAPFAIGVLIWAYIK